MKTGRVLKKAFAKHADRAFLESLVTIHWGQEKSILDIFQGKVNTKDELSTAAYLPGEIIENVGFGPYGLVVKGHITLLANDMDDLFTGKGRTYTYTDPERTKMSGANKGVQKQYDAQEYWEREVLVLDAEDWKPKKTSTGRTSNEALVDNWRPVALIVKEFQKEWGSSAKKAGLDIPIMTPEEAADRL